MSWPGKMSSDANNSGGGTLPTFNKLAPLFVFLKMMAKPVNGRWPRFKWLTFQKHIGFVGPLAAFPAIALRAGGNQILPGMFTALPSGNDVINGQEAHFSAAVLAGEIVPSQHFPFRKRHVRMGPANHIAKFDYRGRFKFGHVAANNTTAVEDDFCLASENKRQCPLDVGYV